MKQIMQITFEYYSFNILYSLRVCYDMSWVNPTMPQQPKNGRWMTFEIIVKMKNGSIGSKFESFLAKYLSDRSCPYRIQILWSICSPRVWMRRWWRIFVNFQMLMRQSSSGCELWRHIVTMSSKQFFSSPSKLKKQFKLSWTFFVSPHHPTPL